MEVVKKKILQALTTGTVYGTGSTKVVVPDGYYTKPENIYLGWTGATGGEGIVIIPDLNVVYNIKISLTAEMEDIGFFDAYSIDNVIAEAEPEPPAPSETSYYEDSDDVDFIDGDGAYFLW